MQLRRWLCLFVFMGLPVAGAPHLFAQEDAPMPLSAGSDLNLAAVAKPAASFVSAHENLAAVNNGADPADSGDKSRHAYGNWPEKGTQWIEYTWLAPIATGRSAVYWFIDGQGVRAPRAARLLYWDGGQFVPVPGAEIGLKADQYNESSFPEIKTTKLRLEIDGDSEFSTGVLEWIVLDSGNSSRFPPEVHAGGDLNIDATADVFLKGRVHAIGENKPEIEWKKTSGHGPVSFANPHAPVTTAVFSKPGDYTLTLTATTPGGDIKPVSSSLHVTALPKPARPALEAVQTRPYSVEGPLWDDRLKQVIVNWIPHCIEEIEDSGLKEGGMNNLNDAIKALAGEPHQAHRGYWFANAWVLNTYEAMCYAQMLDAKDDEDILAAQAMMREKLESWLEKILAAQEPDGYFQTYFTIGGGERWTNREAHEGYIAGYFLDAAMAHYNLTEGRDTRFYDAAKRLVECWDKNVGPAPKIEWWNGHQTMEMSLVQFGQLMNRVEGDGAGERAIALAKFLLDMRGDGQEYDQSHLPVIEQYEAVGHAVRASYSYTGMADVAIATGDIQYQSAVDAIWDNLVNRKYYINGGIGSGETSEGFGENYSLPLNAYCESCAGCGMIFFEARMNRIRRDAKYVSLLEESLYNNVLGSLDVNGENFTYTNALVSDTPRYGWHVCPCCVGNIPRTLLQLPTWIYAKEEGALYVNLFAASRVNVGEIAGTKIEMVQETNYPWEGGVAITVNPEKKKRFAIYIHAPQREASELYQGVPEVSGLTSLTVNGEPVKIEIKNGYVKLNRKWRKGDTIKFEIPMKVQRVTAVPEVESTRGLAAFYYGPLLYDFEAVDQPLKDIHARGLKLKPAWRPDLLHGIVALEGEGADGKSVMAIPYFSRLNRGGLSEVWIKE